MGIKKMAAVLLSGICMLLCLQMTAYAQKGVSVVEQDEEIDSLMREFYQAKAGADEERLKELSEGYLTRELVYDRIMIETGLAGYRVLNCYSQKLNSQLRIVLVVYEADIVGFSGPLSCSETWIAVKAGNDWKILVGQEDTYIKELDAFDKNEKVVSVQTQIDEAIWNMMDDAVVHKWLEECIKLADERVDESDKSTIQGGKERLYQVKKGDSLWKISEEKMGGGAGWKALYEENRDLIGNNPDVIFPGMWLAVSDGPEPYTDPGIKTPKQDVNSVGKKKNPET